MRRSPNASECLCVGTKQCRACGQDLPLSEFYRRGHNGYESKCKPCLRAKTRAYLSDPEVKARRNQFFREQRKRDRETGEPVRREWGAFDEEKVKLNRRRAGLKHLYGISLEDYEQMLVSQNGVCASCGFDPGDEVLCVDHCHSSGRVRGLLCGPCNRALGHAKEDVDRLMSLAAYVLQSQSVLDR